MGDLHLNHIGRIIDIDILNTVC